MNPTDESDSVSKVSSRSKKEDILSAYNELVEKMQENVEESTERKSKHEKQEERTMIAKAADQSAEVILKNIAELEAGLRKSLGDLAQSLLAEYDKLTQLQKAVSFEKKYLEEIHQIKVEAETLASLIQAHKEKKIKLEEEYVNYDRQLIKEKELKEDEWQRQEADYDYELSVKHKKEEAEYEEKKVAREKVLKEREEKMMQIEKEFTELKKLKAMFDQTLKDEMARVEQETAERVQYEEGIKAKLLAENVAAEKRINQLTIGSLQKQVTEREEDIKRLKQELEIANRGVKDIAIKVIEGHSRASEEHRGVREGEKNATKVQV